MEEHEAMRVKTEMETEGSIEVEMDKEVEVKMEEGVKWIGEFDISNKFICIESCGRRMREER